MLKNYLTSSPATRFILIEDSLEQRGKPLFDILLKKHLERENNSSIHYFAFHDTFNNLRRSIGNRGGVTIHDYSSNTRGWDTGDLNKKDFESEARLLSSNEIVFVDCLANAIYQNGFGETYKIFNILVNDRSIQQIVTLLHTDLLVDKDQVIKAFAHLSTLYITLIPKPNSNRGRAHYLYKKLGGKIIKQQEEYSIDGNVLTTEKIEKLDPKAIIEKSMAPEVNPDTLTTFKIGLTDKDRESRDQLVLPYLPQNDESSGGKIIYQFEDTDDWDEEDPDDDLDI